MKSFLFMYPINEYFQEKLFEGDEEYFRILNKTIDLRYRLRGFDVNFALFDDRNIHPKLIFEESDNIINVGLDFEEHIKKVNGKYPYPDQDFILDQLKNPNYLVVSGFHRSDCVSKIAKRSYERGIDTLIDEDLTDLFFNAIYEGEFEITFSPNDNSKKSYFQNIRGTMLEKMFNETRKDISWLWQV